MKVVQYSVDSAHDNDSVYGDRPPRYKSAPSIYKVRVEMLMTSAEVDRFQSLMEQEAGAPMPARERDQAPDVLPGARPRRLGP